MARPTDHCDELCARALLTSSAILMLVEHLAGIGLGDGVPAFPGDIEDDEGNDKADDWVGEVQPKGNHAGARQHAEADEAVDAGVISVRNECGTVQSTTGAQTHL